MVSMLGYPPLVPRETIICWASCRYKGTAASATGQHECQGGGHDTFTGKNIILQVVSCIPKFNVMVSYIVVLAMLPRNEL
jgi:hypothetical protein